MRVYYDRDADVNLIKGKNVAIVGYGSQGHAHANNLKDSGAKNLAVGLRPGSQGVAKAETAGLKVMDPAECAKWADVVMVLTPDEGQGDLYREKLGPNMKSGAAGGCLAWAPFSRTRPATRWKWPCPTPRRSVAVAPASSKRPSRKNAKPIC